MMEKSKKSLERDKGELEKTIDSMTPMLPSAGTLLDLNLMVCYRETSYAIERLLIATRRILNIIHFDVPSIIACPFGTQSPNLSSGLRAIILQ